MFSEEQITAVAIAAISGKGHSEYVGNPDHAGRYIVGGLETVTYPRGTENDYSAVKGLAAMANETDAETLGVWHDNGTVYIDLGDTWTHLSAALQAASHRGELAIWDTLTNSAITL